MRFLIIFLLIISGLLLCLDQSRSFYQISNGKYITVWKRLGGKCYITLDKYYGITKPKNYIKTTNDNIIIILFDTLSTNYVIYNSYGKSLIINSSEKIDYYNRDERNDFFNRYYKGDTLLNQYKYLVVFIKESYVKSNYIIKK